MKKLFLLFALFSGVNTIHAQQMPGLGFPNRYFSIVDTSWFRWKERGYSFGFNSSLTPMYTNVNGILHDSGEGKCRRKEQKTVGLSRL